MEHAAKIRRYIDTVAAHEPLAVDIADSGLIHLEAAETFQRRTNGAVRCQHDCPHAAHFLVTTPDQPDSASMFCPQHLHLYVQSTWNLVIHLPHASAVIRQWASQFQDAQRRLKQQPARRAHRCPRLTRLA